MHGYYDGTKKPLVFHQGKFFHLGDKIMDIAIETGMPVSLGITGPGQTRLQAEARIEKARSAVESVVKMLKANKN